MMAGMTSRNSIGIANSGKSVQGNLPTNDILTRVERIESHESLRSYSKLFQRACQFLPGPLGQAVRSTNRDHIVKAFTRPCKA